MVDLTASRSVAVVGTRKPSEQGLLRTRKLVRRLVNDRFTVVSGLAAGIDTMAHQTAIKEDGQTIAVLGTPLSGVYPRGNDELQQHIAENFLVISQVPVKAIRRADPSIQSFLFPRAKRDNVRPH